MKEIILATNPDVQGEATAAYISRLLAGFDVKVSRIAHGIPIGAELEYADEITLAKALEGRTSCIKRRVACEVRLSGLKTPYETVMGCQRLSPFIAERRNVVFGEGKFPCGRYVHWEARSAGGRTGQAVCRPGRAASTDVCWNRSATRGCYISQM